MTSLPAGDPREVLSLQAPCAPYPSEAQLGAGTWGEEPHWREGPQPSLPPPGDAPGLWRMGTGILSNATQKLLSSWLHGKKRKRRRRRNSIVSKPGGRHGAVDKAGCPHGSAFPARTGHREATQLIPLHLLNSKCVSHPKPLCSAAVSPAVTQAMLIFRMTQSPSKYP